MKSIKEKAEEYGYALLFHIKHVHKLQHILWALGLDANLKI